MLAAITGLAALLHASAVAFQAVKYAGVAYLLWMAWSDVARDRRARGRRGDAAPRSAARVIVSGVLVNLLNPKLTIFFFAFLPQFVAPGTAHVSLAMVELSAVFMAVTFVVFALYGVCAGALRTRVLARPRVMVWLRRSFGGAFLALAGRLALTER